MADADRWKEKYLALLEQQELEHQQQGRQLDQLRRLLVRVSLAADGADPEIDAVLAELRERLREGADARLEPLQGRLESAVLALDQRRQERGAAQLDALRRIAEQALALRPPRPVARELKALCREFERQGASPPLAAWQSLAGLQAQAVQAVAGAEAGSQGWLGFLRRRPALPAEASAEPPEGDADAGAAAAEPGPEQAPAGAVPPPPSAAGEAEGEGLPAFSRIGESISRQLTDLLRQMDIPELARHNAERVHAKIVRGLNWYELVAVLEDVSLVVLTAMELQRREFEGFLQALDQRLSEAGLSLVAMHSAREEVVQQAEVLEHSMRQEVQAIGHSVEESTELDQLKSSVRGKLDAILQAVDRFRREGGASHASLAEQLKSMAGRIEQMERESSTARDALEQQRARLLRDVLTQLPNREALEERIALEFERWQRYGRPLSLVVGDVDFFKRINDGYGHQAGDKVLRVIARTLAKRLRKTDFVARYGGEEFVFLLPETDMGAALPTIEGLREAVEQCPFHFKDQPLPVTMSFGITAFRPGDTPETAFERADQALYAAKNGGRNRCVCDG